MTRDCPAAGYLFSSVRSFFPRQDILTAGLEIYSFLQSKPISHCLSLVDLDQLGKKMQNEVHRKNIISLLAPDEKKFFSTFSYPKRQIEWLGGRIAGKFAALLLLEEEISTDRFASITIMPREDGSPGLKSVLHSDRLPSVSISHSGRFAAGMAANNKVCGVDIQKITDKTQKVVTRFAESDEIRLLAETMPDLNKTQHLSLLWSAKEAIKKALLKDQPVIFQGVLLKDLHFKRFVTLCLQFPGKAPRLAEVNAAIIGEYILAFTVHTNSHA
ncbi:MAG: 4'-phosphopantetheinyl transferase superfamily protein [Desulfobulbaceae bacterium]|nr:4'-phosphopantetheinyl transferase superfamily protein [Desulfobulbaceae bacterium]